MLVLARSAAMYRMRITNSIGLLCLGVGFAALYHYTGLTVVGQVLPMLTFMLMMVCLFAGVHLTADAIAREKRDGTIGLLFLTPLTAFQIVIGKLIAHALMGFYAVLIVMPLLSLIMIVGGTRMTDLVVITLAALNVLFFSASVGLWASARHKDRKKAGGSGTWVVLFFWWGIPMLVQGLLYLKAPLWLIDAMNALSVNGMFNSTMTGRVRLVDSPWVNFVITHALAWAFLGSATYYLQQRWQEVPAKERFSVREWWRQKSLGSPEVRWKMRKQLLDQNPFFWLSSRDRWRSFSVWLTTAGMIAFMAFQFWLASGEVGPIILFGAVLAITHKVQVAAASAHQLGVEQEQGTLEMILSTPLSVESVLKGQLLSSAAMFRGPAVVGVLVHGFAIALVLLMGEGRDETFWGITAILVHCALYLFELYVMAWLGMYGAVTVKEAKNAAGVAMVRIIVMPPVIFGVLFSSLSLANWYFRLGLDPFIHSPVIFAFYFAIWIVNSVGWLMHARRRMPQMLREYALRRYSPEEKATFWTKVGGLLGRAWAGPKRQKQVQEAY